MQLPWKIQFSSLFRAQSGFPYTQNALVPIDQDGNGNFNGRDLKTGRNAFTAPHFLNMDNTRGFYTFLRYMFGDLILPNTLWPTWMLEGLAVYEETRTSPMT